MKLNLGCNGIKLPGWINIDIDSNEGPDMVLDVTKTLPFPEDSISAIMASHIIEHMYTDDAEVCLKHWHDLLTSDGILYVSIPDLKKIARIFLLDPNPMQFAFVGVIYGGDNNTTFTNSTHTEHNRHKCGYIEESLKELVEKCGYKVGEEWNPRNMPEFDGLISASHAGWLSINWMLTKGN